MRRSDVVLVLLLTGCFGGGDPNQRLDGGERDIERFCSVENHEESDAPEAG